MDKIKFGVKNVHYAKITKYDETTEKYTFGEIKKWPGCTAISLPAAGSLSETYADDVKYYVLDVNQGYDGNVDFLTMPEDVEINIFGNIKNDGVMYEKADVQGSEFALFGEFQGSESPKRWILYRCKASRPDFSGSTKEESVTPETISMDIQAMPRENDNVVKASVRKVDNAEKFAAWFTEIHEPVLPDEPVAGGENGLSNSEKETL